MCIHHAARSTIIRALSDIPSKSGAIKLLIGKEPIILPSADA